MIALFGGPLSRIERAALAIGLCISASMMWPTGGALCDGAYVWLHIAHHVSKGAGLAFNVGDHVYAVTNPLWVTLLADGMWLGLDGPMVARVLGGAATLLTVPLFLQLLRRTVRTPELRALGTLAWAANAWMARWALSGLEAPLAVALVLGGFVALTEGPGWGDRPIRTGALWALAAITRPGAVLLLALWATVLLIDAQSRPGLRRLVFGLLPVAAIYGSWLLFARLSFGTFWPSVLATAPPLNPSYAEWWRRMTVDFGRIAATEGALVVAGVMALVLGKLPSRKRDRSALRSLPLLWVILLPALFAARGLQVEARHLLIVIPVAQWLVWWAIDRTWSGERNESRAWVRATLIGSIVAVLVIGQNLRAYQSEVLPDSARQQQTMKRTLIRWGRWLGANDPGALVATDTPGALAYFGNARILDLNGLFTPQLEQVRRAQSRRELVERLAFGAAGRPSYLVDRGVSAAELKARSPYPDVFEPIEESDGYVFYRLRWSAMTGDSTLKP